MMEYAAFGFATLVWWTWPLMAALVFFSVWAAWSTVTWQEDRRDRDAVRPCLEYLGPDVSGGVDHWCWQRDGHDGEHLNQWGFPRSDFDEPYAGDGHGDPAHDV